MTFQFNHQYDLLEKTIHFPPPSSSIASTSISNNLEEDFSLKQETLAKIHTHSGDYITLATNVWDALIHRNPTIQEKVNQFTQRHRAKIKELLRGATWYKLKANLKDKMELGSEEEGISWQTFRNEAKKLIESMVETVAIQLELPKHHWFDTGTIGYQSDIDTVLCVESGVSEQDQMLLKILFDTGWSFVFQGLSGTQADIESYLMHPGQTKKTFSKLSSPEAKKNFIRLELSMAFLQARKGFGTNLKGWKTFQSQMLDQIDNFSLRSTLGQIFNEVEAFESVILTGIEEAQSQFGKNQRSPEELKQASLIYKTARLLTLSKQMDDDLTQITRKQKFLDSSSQNIDSETKKNVIRELERLEVRLATCAAVRNSFFDEAYFTQGAFNVVCNNEGGQVSHKRDKNILSLLESNQENPKEFSIISKKTYPFSKTEELIASQQENLGMLQNKIHKCEYTKQEASQIAVEVSKYSERTMTSSVQLLDKVTTLYPENKIILSLFNEAKKIHYKTVELEKCKRQFVLNKETSKSTLETLLTETYKTSTHVNRSLHFDCLKEMLDRGGSAYGLEVEEEMLERKIKEDTQKLLDHFESNGKWGAEELLPKQKYDLALTFLKQKNYIQLKERSNDFQIEPPMPKLEAVLKARSGFPRLKDQEVQNLHQSSLQITTQAIDLVSKESVNRFHQLIGIVSAKILALSVECKIIPSPSFEHFQECSILEIWENTNPEDL